MGSAGGEQGEERRSESAEASRDDAMEALAATDVSTDGSTNRSSGGCRKIGVDTAYVSTAGTITATAFTPGGDVAVAVSNNGADFTTGPVQFHYEAPMTLLSLAPVHGPTSGGTLLTLTGSGFPSP